jgi:hypothetical protein
MKLVSVLDGFFIQIFGMADRCFKKIAKKLICA